VTQPPRHTIFETPVIRSILRGVAIALLWLARWRTQVILPESPKLVLVIAPHTSYWDFPILLAAALKHRVHASWLGKHTLFRGPFRWVFRWLGGIPVDPKNRGDGRVSSVVQVFDTWDRLWLAIAPEAGLSRVERWRSGFYHIALDAEVPLWLGFVDYGERAVGACEHFIPTGDMSADFGRISAFYATKRARHPERFALPTNGL
jgi:1-acyl-sn-glycerol-3-phosphate acyltransferase